MPIDEEPVGPVPQAVKPARDRLYQKVIQTPPHRRFGDSPVPGLTWENVIAAMSQANTARIEKILADWPDETNTTVD